MIKSVDDSVGRVMGVLDELGLSEQTCVFFFSDNGGLHTVTDNAPLRLGKGFPYEGGIREALAVYWPGTVRARRRTPAIVSSIDFFPTILSLAGLGLPRGRTIDGVDFSGVVRGFREFLPERDLFWHFRIVVGTRSGPGRHPLRRLELIRFTRTAGTALHHRRRGETNDWPRCGDVIGRSAQPTPGSRDGRQAARQNDSC
jgi:hypothetical protein